MADRRYKNGKMIPADTQDGLLPKAGQAMATDTERDLGKSNANGGGGIRHRNMNSASNAALDSQYGSGISASMQLLTPQEVIDQDYDLNIEDFDDSSECTCDDAAVEEYEDGDSIANTGRTLQFDIPEPLTDRSKRNKQVYEKDASSEDDDYASSRQLVIFEDENDDIEVSSDEEREIIKEIKEEIKTKMKIEMSDELQIYKATKDGTKQAEQKGDDLAAMEPNLKSAFLKMRKLDKVLQKKMRREREVKRERILLQIRLQEELNELKKGGKKMTTDEKRNTEKFLMLALPPAHNIGVNLDEQDISPPHSPVFQTQIPDDCLQSERSGAPGVRRSLSNRGGTSVAGDAAGSRSEATNSSVCGTTSAATMDSQGKRVKRKKNKDFVKRNIQLASDAGNAIAMTDDEKGRLEELLADLESLPDIPEDEAITQTEAWHEAPGSRQLSLAAGDGFLPSTHEMRRLSDIDSRLRQILPPEDFQSIATTPSLHSPGRDSIDTRVTHTYWDPAQPGDLDLKENREQRDVKTRLRDIEGRLSDLSSAVELEMVSPSLSENQLNQLLDECSRTMSRATAETDSLAQSTARSSFSTNRESLLENPPSLPPNVLQQLLADAREELSGNRAPPHRQGNVMLESVTEETMRGLLEDSRATSRALESRSSQSRGTGRDSQTRNRPLIDGARAKIWSMDGLCSGSGICSGSLSPSPAASPSPSPSSSEGSPCADRQPFLPAIDPGHSMLVTQKLSNQRLNNEGAVGGRATPSSRSNSRASHSSLSMLRNSLTAEGAPKRSEGWESRDGVGGNQSGTFSPVPRPPESGRRSGSGGRSRKAP